MPDPTTPLAAPNFAAPATRTPEDHFKAMVEEYGVPEEFARTIKTLEGSRSHDTPTGVLTSPKNARGWFQVLPETAAAYGLDADDPFQNIEAGVRNMREAMEKNGWDAEKAFRYYHGGSDLAKHGPLTQDYARRGMQALHGLTAADEPGAPGARPGVPQMAPFVTGEPFAPPAPPLKPGQRKPVPTAEEVKAMTAAPNAKGAETIGPAPSMGHAQVGRAVTDFASEALHSFKPSVVWEGIKALPESMMYPEKVYGGMLDQQRQIIDRGTNLNAGAPPLFGPGGVIGGGGSMEDYRRGLHGRLLTSAAMIPFLGPRLAEAVDYGAEGEPAKAAGAVADVGIQTYLGTTGAPPELRTTPRVFRPRLTPAEQRAIDMGHANDIPLSAATVSGSGFARSVETATQATPIGNAIARVRGGQVARRMEALAQRLGRRVHPQELIGSEAGESAMAAVTRRRDRHVAEADVAYDSLRTHAGDPRHARIVQTGTRLDPTTGQQVPVRAWMQLPVDVRATRAALRPLYEDMTRRRLLLSEAELPGLQALEHFINAPDHVPLTQIERDLGSLKRMARGGEPGNRNISQGLAARAVDILQREIDTTAARAGPDVIGALRTGRQSRAAQARVQEVLDRLEGTHGEPVQAFKRLIDPGNLDFLRTVAHEVPSEIPRLARANLEELFRPARGLEDSWKRMEKLAGDWEKMHPEVKHLLYGRNAQDLDSFFLLGRKLAENPNPSGTGRQVIAAGIIQQLFIHPTQAAYSIGGAGLVSALMNTEGGVRLLTEGLTIPAGGVRAAAWTNQFNQLVARVTDEEGRATGTTDTGRGSGRQPTTPGGGRGGARPPAPPPPIPPSLP